MREKILTLFEYREFPYLLKFVPEKRRDILLEQLIELQEAIYHLDTVLESKWEIKDEEFDPHWATITEKIIATGISAENAPSYLSLVRTYLKHEMLLRDGIAPTSLDIEEYYYYKSCDVKLIRKLIWENSEVLTQSTHLDDWKYFDYITEIDDDTSDIVEDHDSINGNGVVFYLNEYGHNEAVKILEGFIKSAKIRSEGILSNNPTDTWLLFINSTTEKVYHNTHALIGQLKSVLLHQDIDIAENKTVRLVTQTRKLKPEVT